eukprot:500152-Rhodomonas_salina.1
MPWRVTPTPQEATWKHGSSPVTAPTCALSALTDKGCALSVLTDNEQPFMCQCSRCQCPLIT